MSGLDVLRKGLNGGGVGEVAGEVGFVTGLGEGGNGELQFAALFGDRLAEVAVARDEKGGSHISTVGMK